jgi:hypothetical protein
MKPTTQDVIGPRAIGTRIHLALSLYYGANEDPLEVLKATIEEDERYLNEDDFDQAKVFTSEAELSRIMLEGYLQWLQETGADQGLRVTAAESIVEVPFDAIPGVVLVGKLDLRILRESDQARLFLDHKTVGSLTQPQKTLHMDEQMLHYMLLEMLDARYGSSQQVKGQLSGGVSRAQPSGPVAVQHLQETSLSAAQGSQSTTTGPPQGPQSVEQQSNESRTGASRMPLQPSQQRTPFVEDAQDSRTSEKTQRSSEAQRSGYTQAVGGDQTQNQRGSQGTLEQVARGGTGAVPRGVRPYSPGEETVHVAGGLYNMLRRVKRTERAKPPFFERLEVHHNIHELRNYYLRIFGEIEAILETRRKLDAGAEHRQVAYMNPTGDCSWDCEFYGVCPLFDDGSAAEEMLQAYYRQGSPHEHYFPLGEREHLRVVRSTGNDETTR